MGPGPWPTVILLYQIKGGGRGGYLLLKFEHVFFENMFFVTPGIGDRFRTKLGQFVTNLVSMCTNSKTKEKLPGVNLE